MKTDKPELLFARFRPKTARGGSNALAYWLLAPALGVLVVTLLAPLFYNLFLSLMSFNLLRPNRTHFVGLDNFVAALTDPNQRWSLVLTVGFTALAVAIEMVLGTATAFLLNLFFVGNRLARTLVLMPMLASEVVAGLSWRLLYDAHFGILNYFLGLVGIGPQIWLGPDLAVWSTIVVEVWQQTPFVTLIMLAGLQAMPRELTEAATIDGASPLQRLIHVTLPVLSPVILLALAFRTMFTLRVFTPVWMLTGGGPADKTLVVGVDIYRTAFRYYDFGRAATLSVLLLLITLAITLAYMRLLRREALS